MKCNLLFDPALFISYAGFSLPGALNAAATKNVI